MLTLAAYSYRTAAMNAHKALMAATERRHDPITYKEKHDGAVFKFRNFKANEHRTCEVQGPPRTEAQDKADVAFMWKVYCRKGRGYVGLCNVSLDKLTKSLAAVGRGSAQEFYAEAAQGKLKRPGKRSVILRW